METLYNTKKPSHRLPYSTPHKCPKCARDFFGRYNKVFCSKECKIKYNNDRASEMNSRVTEQVRMLKRNAEILDELYSQQLIPFREGNEDLIRKGFVIKCPATIIKAESGEIWSQIGNYVFKPTDDGREVDIMTKEDLEKI